MPIVVVVLTVLLLVAAHKLCKTWITPAAINALMWSCFALGAVIFYGTSELVNFIGVTYLLLLAFAMIMGDWLAQKYGAAVRTGISTVIPGKMKLGYQHNLRTLRFAVICCVALGVFREIFTLYMNGYSLLNFLSLEKFLEMNQGIANQRYHGDGGYSSTFMQLLLCFEYAAPFCGGWVLPLAKKKRDYILSFASLLPIALGLLITNGKAGVIASVMLWATGLIISATRKNRKDIAVNRKLVIIVAVSLAAFLGVLFFSMMARAGSLDGSVFTYIVRKFAVYAFGHMEAFDIWFNRLLNGLESQKLGWGSSTFMAVYNVFTNGEKMHGVYVTVGGSTSNVFSGYRGLVTDFGIVGAVFAALFVGYLGGMLYRSVRDNEKISTLEIVVLAATYFWLLYSMIISPWIYTSFVCAFVLIFVFLEVPGSGKAVWEWIKAKLKGSKKNS